MVFGVADFHAFIFQEKFDGVGRNLIFMNF